MIRFSTKIPHLWKIVSRETLYVACCLDELSYSKILRKLRSVFF